MINKPVLLVDGDIILHRSAEAFTVSEATDDTGDEWRYVTDVKFLGGSVFLCLIGKHLLQCVDNGAHAPVNEVQGFLVQLGFRRGNKCKAS